MPPVPDPTPLDALLSVDGEMARRMRGFDWASTPLGPSESWPPALRLAVGICLNSRFPMFIWWGSALIKIYNDAYIPILGKRHPHALGRPARETWSDIWDIVGPQADLVMQRGRSTWNERVLLVMERHGFTENTYFTWSYSPIPDEHGRVVGLFCACTEETGRVRAEAERDRLLAHLGSERTRLTQAFEQSPAFLAVLRGPEHVFEFVNERYLQLIGRRDIIGKSVGTALPEVVSQGYVELLDRVYQTGEPFVGSEMRVVLQRDPQGPQEEVYVDFVYQPMRGDDGSVGGILVQGIDLTGRKRAEAAAHEAERQYKAVFEAARDAVIVYTPEGIIAEANPAACRTYGYSYDELIGLDACAAVHPEALPFFKEFLRISASGEPYHCETVDRRRDGSVFPIEVVGTSLIFQGRPHVMSVVRDIADRKRAVERMTRLHAVAAALSEALTVEQVARVAVEQGVAALGATAGSIALLSSDDVTLEIVGSIGYEPEVMRQWRRFTIDAPIPLADAVRTGEAVYLHSPEERLSRYPALASVRATRGTHASACLPLLVGGSAIGVLGLSFDQLGALAAEDREFILSLTRQCAQALERARLYEAERHARAEAEHASRAKDEFLATLSHELRTPLSAILGWSQIILRGGARSDDMRQGLEVIQRNARSQAQIIDDLLDMSRIISGKVRLEVKPLDLRAVVRAAIETVQHAADARSITIEAPPPGAAPITVSGDPNRLQQVFWNLASNAIKFTPASGRVTVAIEHAASGQQVHVRISDSGEGISREFLPHVFDRFRQADSSTTRRHGGLGLGLSIVKQLVELHGGTVGVASEGLGRGATFTVALPLRGGVIAPSGTSPGSIGAVPATLPATKPLQPLTGLRIVMVDDDPDSRTMAKRLLDDCGALTTLAGSAAEAYDLVCLERPDVLVSDIGMPGEDGYALMRRIRMLPPTAAGATPAVALTAFASAEDRGRAIAAGYQSHVAKPVDAAELVAAIAGIVALRRDGGEWSV